MHASVACDHPQSDKGPSHVWTRAAQKRGRSIMSPPTDHHSWMQLPRNHRQGAAMRSLPALETQLTGERSSAEDAGKLERRASRGAAWASDLLQIRGTKIQMCTKHPRCRLGPCAAVARPAAVCVCRSSSEDAGKLERRASLELLGRAIYSKYAAPRFRCAPSILAAGWAHVLQWPDRSSPIGEF